MRVLVLSDVHGNDVALDAVLAHAPVFDAAWCLGDLVGYGPGPNECVERIRQLPGLICLIGNHDHAALGLIPLSRFHDEARTIVEWTRDHLNHETVSFLKSLQPTATVGDFTLAHGSPRHPTWEYVIDPHIAEANFATLSTPYCLVGHSHFPLIFHRPGDEHPIISVAVQGDQTITLNPRMLLNPGSVGQPRDMDPRASYAVLDTDAMTWDIRRVPYDIKRVQSLIIKAGLPARQALRLQEGW